VRNTEITEGVSYEQAGTTSSKKEPLMGRKKVSIPQMPGGTGRGEGRN